jgi:hypothetical protein
LTIGHGLLQDLFRLHAELVLHVDGARGDEGVDDRVNGVANGPHAR